MSASQCINHPNLKPATLETLAAIKEFGPDISSIDLVNIAKRRALAVAQNSWRARYLPGSLITFLCYNPIKPGNVSIALKYLLKQGFISDKPGIYPYLFPKTPRHYYTITQKGLQALAQERSRLTGTNSKRFLFFDIAHA